jgi:hypothetical protein
MPKGVYDRSSRKSAVAEPAMPVIQQNPGNPGDYRVNTVQVSQMPDRQSANSNVEIMRQTHGDETVSTTERLFGDMDLTKEEEGLEQQPLKSVEPVPQNPDEAEQPKFQEAKPEEPAPVESKPDTSDEFIDWDKMAGKKIRQKIDGKEVIVTAEELKGYSDQDQIKKHLAEAANKVGEERRRLAEERKQIQELRQQRASQYEAPLQNGQPQDIPQPSQDYNPVLQRIQFLESQLQQLAQGTQPVIYETNRQRVSNELKAQGFNDFMDYLPKMEMHMTTINDPQLAGFYDTPQGAKSLYFQLKAQDMLKTPQAKIVQQDVSRRTVTSNPVPPATQIDSGSQPSGSFNDDSGHNYRQAFRRATNLGDDKEAWNEVLRQKGILPEG